LGRCLEKDPKQRLRDIGEARFLLEEEPKTAPSQPRLGWAAAAVLLATLAAVSYVAWKHLREEPARVVKLALLPPTTGSFAPGIPTMTVSPDGRRVAFEADIGGKWGLWVRDLDNPEPHLLAPINGNRCIPFWAPDSRRLGFFDGTRLKKIDVTGGPASTITDDGALPPASGSWNQDDVIVFGRLGGTLFRIPATGGTPAPLTQLDKARGETAHWAPWFLPDGRHFLFTAISTDSEKSGVYIGDLASKTKKRVIDFGTRAIYVNPGYLLFVREGTLMAQPFNASQLETMGDAVPVVGQVQTFTPVTAALGHFSASQNGLLVYTTGTAGDMMQLTWYDRMGNRTGTVGAPGYLGYFSLSPDGATVAFSRRGSDSGRDIWTHDVARGNESPLTTGGINDNPVWSADGKRLYFLSNRDGALKVYWKNANNTGSEEVIEAARRSSPQDASPDGKYLLTQTIETNPKTGVDIWVLPLFGDGKPYGYVETTFVDSDPRLSPDLRWLAYQSDRSKNFEVYAVSFPQNGESWQVSTDGGRLPVWRSDGRELYYYSRDNQIMAVEVKPSAPGSTQSPFGVPRKLFDARISNINPGFAVSKDGRFLLKIPVGQQEASVPMTVVLNWPQLLK
jgi:Tol biopolymer transport system component